MNTETKKQEFMKIGEFSKIFGLTRATIRKYVKQGLIPDRRVTPTGKLMFSQDDVINLKELLNEKKKIHKNT